MRTYRPLLHLYRINILSPPLPSRTLPSFLRAYSADYYNSDRPTSTLSDAELSSIRAWLADFSPASIPRKACSVTFSRASGPGGQNVNKVNSKCTLKASLENAAIRNVLHPKVLEALKESKWANREGEIVISADSSRKQGDNVDECFRKLFRIVREAVEVPGVTSELQKEKVAKLAVIENERRLKKKKKQSDKKQSRRVKDNDY